MSFTLTTSDGKTAGPYTRWANASLSIKDNSIRQVTIRWPGAKIINVKTTSLPNWISSRSSELVVPLDPMRDMRLVVNDGTGGEAVFSVFWRQADIIATTARKYLVGVIGSPWLVQKRVVSDSKLEGIREWHTVEHRSGDWFYVRDKNRISNLKRFRDAYPDVRVCITLAKERRPKFGESVQEEGMIVPSAKGLAQYMESFMADYGNLADEIQIGNEADDPRDHTRKNNALSGPYFRLRDHVWFDAQPVEKQRLYLGTSLGDYTKYSAENRANMLRNSVRYRASLFVNRIHIPAATLIKKHRPGIRIVSNGINRGPLLLRAFVESNVQSVCDYIALQRYDADPNASFATHANEMRASGCRIPIVASEYNIDFHVRSAQDGARHLLSVGRPRGIAWFAYYMMKSSSPNDPGIIDEKTWTNRAPWYDAFCRL